MPSRARTRLYRLAFMGLLLLLAAIDARAQGELIWHGPQGDVSLPVLDVAVEIDVRGPMLEGRVLQTFTNPLPEAIEMIRRGEITDAISVAALLRVHADPQ